MNTKESINDCEASDYGSGPVKFAGARSGSLALSSRAKRLSSRPCAGIHYMLRCLLRATVGNGSRVFARDDKNFARDDIPLARDDKNLPE